MSAQLVRLLGIAPILSIGSCAVGNIMTDVPYTISELPISDIGPSCPGRGHFFVHEEGPDFRLVVINGNRVKDGAFSNGKAPSFIENRNLNKLPQGARGASIMYNPEITRSTDPSKLKPGAIYRFAIIHFIDGRTDTMQIYEFDDGQQSGANVDDGNRHGEEWSMFTPGFPGFHNEIPAMHDFLLNHCIKKQIQMGKHSFFFVNQIDGQDLIDCGEVMHSDNLINTIDKCYQCSIDGPDVYDDVPKHFNEDNVDSSVNRASSNVEFFEQAESRTGLKGSRIDLEQPPSYEEIKIVYGDTNVIFRPFVFDTYDNTPQDVFFVRKENEMNKKDPRIKGLFGVHHPSTFNENVIEVSYIDRDGVNEMMNLGRVDFITFEGVLSEIEKERRCYANTGYDFPLSSQIRVLNDEEFDHLVDYPFEFDHVIVEEDDDEIDPESSDDKQKDAHEGIVYSDPYLTDIILPMGDVVVHRVIHPTNSYALPGHMLVRWSKDERLAGEHATRHALDLFRKANRNGYGNRIIAKSMGITSYFGKRGTNQSSPSPVEGPGNANKSQYFRMSNQHHPEYMVVANKLLNRVANAAIRVRKAHDPIMNMIHRVSNHENFSRMKSATFGKPKESMAFACGIHTDKTDRYKKADADELMMDFYLLSQKNTPAYQKELRYSYVSSFYDRYGIGKPTTVMYHHIPGISALGNVYCPVENGKILRTKLQQVFIHDGLFCASPIQHGDCMVFHAYAFRHGSSVALEVSESGLVKMRNDNDQHILAFSNSS